MGWGETVRGVVEAAGVAVMIGSVDMGKTTRATLLANAAVRAGRRAAVVDADTGQSDIGPPSTVGLGILRRPVRRMAEIPLEAAFFVGDTSPQDVYDSLVEGTARMVSRARARGMETIVVDTTGWVEGPAAVAAKLRKINRIQARHVVAIQRADEVEPILARISREITIHRLRPGRAVRCRSRAERRMIRERRFAQYFAGAKRLTVDLRSIPAGRLAVYAGRRIPQPRMLHEIPLRALHHLLVGLADGEGCLVALGTVGAVRPRTHEVDLLAPLDSLDDVRALQWGVLRVAPSGREEGRLVEVL
jgi:polynucleotide 5'-hydroxyl-kinase GRC3/NOL9